jgi:WD40 repeat protein
MRELSKRLSSLPRERRIYTFRHLPQHLAQADQTDRLQKVLWSVDFLKERLAVLSPRQIAVDYNLLPTDNALRNLRGALLLSADVLTQDPGQLKSQLYGRLLKAEHPDVVAFRRELEQTGGEPWLRPLKACLTAPGDPLITSISVQSGMGVHSVAVTPDGTKIICGSHDGVQIWNADNGELIANLPGSQGLIRDLAVTADGRKLLAASTDGLIRIWNLATMSLHAEFAGHGAPLRAVTVTPDNRWAISGGHDNIIKVWDLQSEKLFRELEGHTSFITDLAVTPDGSILVSSTFNSVYLWNLPDGRRIGELQGNPGRALGITPEGRFVLSGMEIGRPEERGLGIWDIKTGARVTVLSGNKTPIGTLAITPDGRFAITGSYDGVMIWDLTSRQPVGRHDLGKPQEVHSLAIWPDGSRFAAASDDGQLRLWTLHNTSAKPLPDPDADLFTCVLITADGRQVITGSADGVVRLWHPQTGELAGTLEGHSKRVVTLLITPNGGRLISGSYDGLCVWNLQDGRMENRLEASFGGDLQIAMAPGDKRIFIGEGRTLYSWDFTSAEPTALLKTDPGLIYALVITSDGRYALTGSEYPEVRVWDLQSKALQCGLKGQRTSVKALALTPDGDRVVAGSVDGEICVWDIKSAELVATLSGHANQVISVAIAPDGRRVVSSAGDGMLKAWDLARGTLLASFQTDGTELKVAVAAESGAIVGADRSGNLYALDFF